MRALQNETLRLLDQQEKLILGLEEAAVSLGDATGAPSSARAALANERAKVKNLTMTIAVVGTMKAGKSTLLNAIMGDEILPSRETGMTTMPVRISHVAELAEPELHLHQCEGFNVAWRALAARLTDIKQEGGDEKAILNSVGGTDAEVLVKALQAPNDAPFLKVASGKTDIRRSLQLMNDLLRLCAHPEVAVESPLSSISAYTDLPELRVAFRCFAKGEFEIGLGNIAFIDTPGPNEAAQEHLKAIVDDQLQQASAIILVLNYSQLNSASEDALRDQVRGLVEGYPDRIHIVVNRFDERNHTSTLTEVTVRSHVTEKLFQIPGLSTERVFPTSARLALLSQQALEALDRHGALPLESEAPWVPSFGRTFMGVFWQRQIEERDQVSASAIEGMKGSLFEAVTRGVVGHAFENAAPRCIKSALQQVQRFTDERSDCQERLATSLVAHKIEIGKLAAAVKALNEWLLKLELLPEVLQRCIDQTTKQFREDVANEQRAMLERIRVSELANPKTTIQEEVSRRGWHTVQGDESRALQTGRLAKAYNKAKELVQQAAQSRHKTHAEVFEETRDVVKAVVNHANEEAKTLSTRINGLADKHQQTLTDRINAAFAPVISEASALLNEEDFHIEIRLPQFKLAGNLGDDVKMNGDVSTHVSKSSHTVRFKLLWLIPISFFDTITTTTTKTYSTNLELLDKRLSEAVEKSVDLACSDFEQTAFGESSAYREEVGRTFRRCREAFVQEQQTRQGTEAKKQEWVSSLNRLDALRREICDAAKQCEKGMSKLTNKP